MGELLAYSLTSSILLAILYLAYKWALASENYHSLNRSLLWMIYFTALTALPLYKYVSRALAASAQTGHTSIVIDGPMMIDIVNNPVESLSWLTVLLWIYLAGIIIVIALTVINFVRIFSIISRGEGHRVNSLTVVITDNSAIAPFSFGRVIVIPRDNADESARLILLHEQCHVELHHWADLLFAQLVCILQWYNPTAWLMREGLKTVHEYQADNRVITSGADMRQYQLLLIKKAVGARFPSLANSLNHSKLKKRITMMYNQKKSHVSGLRPLLLLPALGVAMWVTRTPLIASAIGTVADVAHYTASPVDKVTDFSGIVQAPLASEGATGAEKKQVANAVEKIAEFPGGMSEMMKYLAENIQFPVGDDDTTGRVVVKFVVEKNGEIGDTKIVKSLTPALDAEAIRVIKSMPRWQPAMSGGQPVASNYTLPVSFKAVDSTSKGAAATAGDTKPKNSSVSTSVSTSTDQSGKQVSTVTVVSYDDNQGPTVYSVTTDPDKKYDYTVFVNGKEYTGNINDISPSDIESMTITKNDDAPSIIHITLKK